MEAFRDLEGEFATANAQVLGVSIDPWPAAEAFRKDLNTEIPLLGDWPLNQTGKDYGVYNAERYIHARTTFVLDKDHVVREVIDDPRDFERHARESLEAIKRLGSG